MGAALANLVLSTVLLVVLAVVNARTLRLPDAIVLPGIGASVVVLLAASLVRGDLSALWAGLLGGAGVFALLLVVGMADPRLVTFGTVKASVLVGVPAGVLGVRPWATGIAVAAGLVAVVVLVRSRAGDRGTIPSGWALLAALGTAVLTHLLVGTG